MVERGRGTGFALEALDQPRSIRQLRGQDLDRDLAVELEVAREEDYGHPAAPEQLLDDEVTLQLFRELCLELGIASHRMSALPCIARYVGPAGETEPTAVGDRSGAAVAVHAPGTRYRQRKICSATTKLTTPHAVTMPNGAPRSLSRLPSIMTARRASFSAVSGSAFTNGCIASGKRAYEKKVPDRIHIGSITRFISPETASMVRARLATSMPSPANARAPSTVMNATALNEPRTPTWNIHQPKPTSAATSRNRNTSRDKMNERR